MKKFLVLLIALIMIATLLVVPGVQTSAEGSYADLAEPDDDWLHVEGTNIVDKYGNKVWITGATGLDSIVERECFWIHTIAIL